MEILLFAQSSTSESDNVMGRYCITLGEMHIVLSEVHWFEPYGHESSTAYPSVLFLSRTKCQANSERK